MKQLDLARAHSLSAKRDLLLEYLNKINDPPKPTLDSKRKPEPNTESPPPDVFCVAAKLNRNFTGNMYPIYLNEVVEISHDFVKIALQTKLAEIERELVGMGVSL